MMKRPAVVALIAAAALAVPAAAAASGGVTATEYFTDHGVVPAVQVAWPARSESYVIYRTVDRWGPCPASVSFYQQIGTASGSPFDDTSVPIGNYCYAVAVRGSLVGTAQILVLPGA